MSSSRQFDEADREAARAFVAAAQAAGVRKIVYLGGLGHGSGLSGHLRSRQEVGEILRASGVPTIELRASIVIGSGSASFEMVRALVEKLPGDGDAPVGSRAGAADRDRGRRRLPRSRRSTTSRRAASSTRSAAPTGSRTSSSCRSTRRQRGLRRVMIPVPVLSPRLSSPVALARDPGLRRGRAEARRLAPQRDGRRRRQRAQVFPVRPRTAREAIAPRARQRGPGDRRDALRGRGVRRALVVRRRARRVAARRHAVRRRCPIRRPSRSRRSSAIGGETGWYKGALLWRLRGLLDVLAGGPGLRRGRRDPVAASGRRHARLLAGRGVRAGSAAPPPRRDEGARTGLAPVRGQTGVRTAPARRPRPRSSSRPGSSGSSTGTCSGPSTASSSAACCGTSRPRWRSTRSRAEPAR